MKKINACLLSAGCLVIMVFFLSSCFKDNCRHAYKIYTPVYSTLSDIRASVKSSAAVPIGNAGKLYLSRNWIFLNEQGKGIHVIDNSHPANPVKAGFINIPGNVDMSVKDNILFADMYSDLAAINISNPLHAVAGHFMINTFPEKSLNPTIINPDSARVQTGWTTRDTAVACNAINYYCNNCPIYFDVPSGAFYAASSSSPSGANANVAGSMARFATVGNYLYAVNSNALRVIDINQPANPAFVQSKSIGSSIETIFPYNNQLYIGASNSMSIFGLQNPADPQKLSVSGHWCSHDPVVVDGKYAYVTLHAANFCGSTTNELDVYDISNAGNPSPVKIYPLVNPKGLSKDGNLLFICDDGLKVYDATVPADMKLVKHIRYIDAYDVIATNGIAYLVNSQGLYQYDYSDLRHIHLLSSLAK